MNTVLNYSWRFEDAAQDDPAVRSQIVVLNNPNSGEIAEAVAGAVGDWVLLSVPSAGKSVFAITDVARGVLADFQRAFPGRADEWRAADPVASGLLRSLSPGQLVFQHDTPATAAAALAEATAAGLALVVGADRAPLGVFLPHPLREHLSSSGLVAGTGAQGLVDLIGEVDRAHDPFHQELVNRMRLQLYRCSRGCVLAGCPCPTHRNAGCGPWNR